MSPTVATIEQVMEYICKMDDSKDKIKLDLSDNWLHANGAAIVLEQVALKLPKITHIDLRHNRIEVDAEEDAAAKRLRKAIRSLISKLHFVRLDLSKNSFHFNWYYKLHKQARDHVTKVIVQYHS